MKLRKIFAIILSLILVSSVFCGCDRKVYITTGLKNNEIFKLSGNPCSIGQIMLILMAEKNRYEADFGTDIWQYENDNLDVNLEKEVKEKAKKQLAKLKTVELLAGDHKIVLEDEEKELLKEAANEYYSSLTEKEVELLKVKEDDVLKLYTSFYIADLVYDKLTKDVNLEVSDEEARVVKCKYIFIDASDDLEAARSEANEVYELLVAGNDFNSVAKQYSDSEEIDALFSRNTVDANFEEEIFSLVQGQTSKVVENEDGCYIFICVSDYLEAETLANKDKIIAEYKKSEYEKIYIPFESEQTFEFNTKVWEKVKLNKYSDVTTSSLYEVYNKYFK